MGKSGVCLRKDFFFVVEKASEFIFLDCWFLVGISRLWEWVLGVGLGWEFGWSGVFRWEVVVIFPY